MAGYKNLMDERQKHLHENFPSNHYLSDPEKCARVFDWLTFWRRNPGRFAEQYFGLTLHLYQHIILALMVYFPSICIVAARSAAKSFVIAVFSCVEAIVRPGARIVVASATKKQAKLIVSEKIMKEILPGSPLLKEEIKGIKDSQNDIEVTFHNGSSIVVVVANDNARGYRATVLVYEEFRMILKSTIDNILSPFLYARQVPFTNIDEYQDLVEEPKEIFISSAYYQNHWMWQHMKIITKDMLEKGTSAMIAMDYSISLRHKIKTRNFLIKERKKLDPTAWQMEYENRMVSQNAHAYFTYDMIDKCRVIKRPFYPRRNEDVIAKIKNKYVLPKQDGEIRVLACDIASEGGNGNDKSMFVWLRLLPESVEYKVSDTGGEHVEVKKGYRRQLVYMEAQTVYETSKQAIRIKQLFSDFDADYCVLDCRQSGVNIYDSLAKVLYDEERNIEYKPWCCMNDDKLKSRVVITGQMPVIFSVKASLELNSRIAVSMRNCLHDKMIEFLVNNQEGIEEIQNFAPEYNSGDIETQIFFERPYLETAALVNDMISLEYQILPQTGIVKIEEKHDARKDRYSSVSYGSYFAELLEQDLFSDNSDYEYVTLID